MNDDLDQLLKLLRLKKMRQIIERELERTQKQPVSHQEFLARLFRMELDDQRCRSTESRIRRARMPEIWSLDTFPWDRQPKADRQQVLQLAQLDFINKGINIVFIGPPGTGKTGIASGILLKALQSGYRGFFIRAQDLFDEMYSTLADRTTRKYLNRLINYDLVCIDEVGYLNLKPEQTNIFFKLMEERYVARKPCLVTTNLDYDEWPNFLKNKPLTDGLLSRLRHRCITLNFDGRDLRDS